MGKVLDYAEVNWPSGILPTMRILITGGSGMLGKAISSKLTNSPRNENALFTPSHAELDFMDYENTHRYIVANRIDSIIHCAAVVGGIQANMTHPFEHLNTNIRIDANLMLAALQANVTNFLYIASSCMYPSAAAQPLKESQILTGELEKTNEGYALAKIVGTKTVEIVGKSRNWRTLVISNMYGPGDKYEIGKSHLIAAVIRKVVEAKEMNTPSVQMWGSGDARREFTFVNDVAEFISTKIFDLNGLPQTMNLGNGIDFTIREYYEFVCDAVQYKGDIVNDLSRPEGMLKKLLDSSIANHNGWNPSTDIRVGLQVTVEDFLLNHRDEK